MTFDEIFDKFVKTKYWRDMLNTREDSPYHREENVGVHTRMVLSAYKDMFYHSRDAEQRLLTQIAILFHDVGKPRAETPKYSEKRGHYRSYGGHEQISACGFMDYACSNGGLGLDINQLRVIRWMIENHLPYEKGPEKMLDWQIDMTFVLGKYQQCFRDLLLSDAKGRITDDDRFGQGVQWLEDHMKETEPKFRMHGYSDYHEGLKTAYVLVGPSCSGKSTVVKSFDPAYTRVFNKDDMRFDFYEMRYGKVEHTVENYDIAWNFCNDMDSEFRKYIQKRFASLVTEGWDIVLDNTNLSVKSRRQWVTTLKQHNYNIIGIEFWSPLSTLIERNNGRFDHQIPLNSMLQQYCAQSSLRFGSEVEEIRIVVND